MNKGLCDSMEMILTLTYLTTFDTLFFSRALAMEYWGHSRKRWCATVSADSGSIAKPQLLHLTSGLRSCWHGSSDALLSVLTCKMADPAEEG